MNYLLILFSFTFVEIHAKETLSSEIIEKCYDGDTCTTKNGEKIRLACIDAQEIKGKNSEPVKAKQSKELLNNLFLNKKVFIKRITTDRYGRTVAELFIDDINIQKLLVNKGLAKVYERYSYQCDWTKK